jgi:hypothetical protein
VHSRFGLFGAVILKDTGIEDLSRSFSADIYQHAALKVLVLPSTASQLGGSTRAACHSVNGPPRDGCGCRADSDSLPPW